MDPTGFSLIKKENQLDFVDMLRCYKGIYLIYQFSDTLSKGMGCGAYDFMLSSHDHSSRMF